MKVSFRRLPNDLVKTDIEISQVSEDELALAVTEVSGLLSKELLVRVHRDIYYMLMGEQPEALSGN